MQIPYRNIFLIETGLNILVYIITLKEKEELFTYLYESNKENKINLPINLSNKVDISSYLIK